MKRKKKRQKERKRKILLFTVRNEKRAEKSSKVEFVSDVYFKLHKTN